MVKLGYKYFKDNLVAWLADPNEKEAYMDSEDHRFSFVKDGDTLKVSLMAGDKPLAINEYSIKELSSDPEELVKSVTEYMNNEKVLNVNSAFDPKAAENKFASLNSFDDKSGSHLERIPNTNKWIETDPIGFSRELDDDYVFQLYRRNFDIPAVHSSYDPALLDVKSFKKMNENIYFIRSGFLWKAVNSYTGDSLVISHKMIDNIYSSAGKNFEYVLKR
jgi:hypothetical protein